MSNLNKILSWSRYAAGEYLTQSYHDCGLFEYFLNELDNVLLSFIPTKVKWFNLMSLNSNVDFGKIRNQHLITLIKHRLTATFRDRRLLLHGTKLFYWELSGFQLRSFCWYQWKMIMQFRSCKNAGGMWIKRLDMIIIPVIHGI